MAYAPIAKLEKFTGEEDDTQIWLNNIEKAITQKENEAVTTYLRYFHRNLHQIQIIQADYFTAPQILNQFIRVINLVMNGSSDLDSKLKQLSDSLNQKLEGHLSISPTMQQSGKWKLIPKLVETRTCHYCGKQGHLQIDCHQYSNSELSIKPSSISTKLPTDNTVVVSNPNDTAIIFTSTLSVSSINLSITVPIHLSAAASGNLSASTKLNTTSELTSKQNPKAKTDTTKLEIVDGSPSTDPQFFKPAIRISTMEFGHWIHPKPKFLTLFKSIETNQQLTLTSNIPPATITKNELLDTIFSFKLEELSVTPLFSKAALEEKPITAMYTDAKVDNHPIKLILDSESADSIITRQLMDQLGHQVDQAANVKIITANIVTKTPIGKIDNLPIEINSIIVLIKVLVIEATQYQALIGNDWLELQLSQNGQHTYVPAMYGYFKTTKTPTPLIKFEKKEKKPTWEAYQVSWTEGNHNKLPSISSWDDNRK
ncbi:hypothetical protein G9A89_015695 [Geosiphon pyriformis]|nr:hypothetical protein G9A89_015695 [Geosiphon pyriformis]